MWTINLRDLKSAWGWKSLRFWIASESNSFEASQTGDSGVITNNIEEERENEEGGEGKDIEDRVEIEGSEKGEGDKGEQEKLKVVETAIFVPYTEGSELKKAAEKG